MATSGIETILNIGIETIYKHNQTLLDILLKTAQENALDIVSPENPLHRGWTLILNFSEPEKAKKILKKHHIMVESFHTHGLRFSPHIYNTHDEINRMSDVLKQLAV